MVQAVRLKTFLDYAHNVDFVVPPSVPLEVLQLVSLSILSFLLIGLMVIDWQTLTLPYAFTRIGWNEGQHESFAYTEVDQTVELGGDYSGRAFSRPNDKLGLAFVSNAIKRDHQNYLRYGGRGFLLGDGKLNYAREDILEGYYNLHAWRGLYYALDAQFIDHPGYNKDRGPALVEAVRMHFDF